MFRQLIATVSFVILVISCSNNAGSRSVALMPRDTTITEQNAFTLLTLDSSAVANFISAEGIVNDEAVNIVNFYNHRNYQYAWFNEDGLTEQGEAFWNLHQANAEELKDSASSSKMLHRYMTNFLEPARPEVKNDTLALIELLLTKHFFEYLQKSFKGKVDPQEMQWYIPRRKLNDQSILDSFLTSSGKKWEPLNKSFYKLDSALVVYVQIAKDGGWPLIEIANFKLAKGMKSPEVAQIKKRLAAGGDFSKKDTSQVFNTPLEEAIKKLQKTYGLAETGKPDKQFLAQVNITVEDRVRQMKINLERMRWMPEDNADRLWANIPEFKLHVFENNKEEMVINIVVGKAANRTVIFSDSLRYIVFSPYWNVPTSIVEKEILPAMARNSNYLNRNNMEILKYSNGQPVIRQKPGRANSLGKVKFLFPNRYNIYFHDTPAKTLFSNQQRAFSHGCIRLQKPFELAKFLLKDQPAWNDLRIETAMNQEKEEWVSLRLPRPVYVVYFTAWVDQEGFLNFRDDIYSHDERMAEHLFN
ncbi:MAG: L,D-transpeptidase family protein [Chitinophagaceae bacterium]|nr:L,D-transpeptidase family protein [Chitinophagaceae bacterium]